MPSHHTQKKTQNGLKTLRRDTTERLEENIGEISSDINRSNVLGSQAKEI